MSFADMCIARLAEQCHNSKKYNFSGEGKNLILWNCEEAIPITVEIFGFKGVYNVP
jgi:hypothetical protein